MNQVEEFKSIQQEEVGIQKYISRGSQILGVIKFLISDFIVNQIDDNKQIVNLKQKPDIAKVDKFVKEVPQYVLTEELLGEIVQNLGKEACKAIEELYQKLQIKQKVGDWEFIIQNITADKQKRKQIHNFVREKLTNIQSNTISDNRMKLKLNKRLKKMNPALRSKYTYFILFKNNVDTMGALFKLSKLTGINQKLFSTAGLKDKRGITTQRVAVYNTDGQSLKKFYSHAEKNKQFWIDGIQQGMIDKINVGDLYGNQFAIIIRLLQSRHNDLIRERMESLKTVGMINYFGMQRFGSCGTKTHMIGLKILQRKWKQVIETLLLEDTKDEEMNKTKQNIYLKGEFKKAERLLPNKLKIEKMLFRGLDRHGLNFQNVFESLPRSIKTLYCHSLQSYLWNRMVSRRIKQHGLVVVKGDIIGHELKGFEKAKEEVEREKNDGNREEEEEDGEQEELKYSIKVVNEENLNDYHISQVVMPLFGSQLDLPKESLANNYFEDELNLIDLKREDFQISSKMLCLKGQYRKMVIKPEKCEYEIINHEKQTDELQNPFYMLGQKTPIVEGSLTAVKLILQLPKSTYATMALREITHMPTDFEVQSKLNKLYKKQ